MGRKAHFKHDEFIDAAMRMVAEKGPGALTVSALASGMNAPIGSVYHRFPSRDVLLAQLWIRIVESFQRGFLESLEHDGLSAALYTVGWVREHPDEARVLLLHRREELVSGPWPSHLKDDAARLTQEMDAGIRRFAEKHFGSLSLEALRRAAFALTDAPLASVRQYVERGEQPPEIVVQLVRETYLAVMRIQR